MITIRPLSPNGTMVRRAIALNLEFKPQQVRESLARAIADSTDSFMRKSKPVKPKPVKPKAVEPKALTALSPGEIVRGLPDDVAIACNTLIYGNIYGHAEQAAKTPNEARSRLSNLIFHSYRITADQCRTIINQQAAKAKLKGFQPLPLFLQS